MNGYNDVLVYIYDGLNGYNEGINDIIKYLDGLNGYNDVLVYIYYGLDGYNDGLNGYNRNECFYGVYILLFNINSNEYGDEYGDGDGDNILIFYVI